MSHALDRRSFLAAAAAAAALPGGTAVAATKAPAPTAAGRRKLKQSVSRWCYGSIPFDEFCKQCAAMGLLAVDLLQESEWEEPKRHGLTCSMAYGSKSMQIGHGLNRKEHHDRFVQEFTDSLPRIQQAGIPNAIVFSGNRQGQSDDEGIAACIAGLKLLQPLAEKAGVTLCMEYLNSKVDHHDYAFDRMRYGVEVCKAVGSERVKLLYDIYHAQIMEGDVIRTLRDHIRWIGHFHTGGVPGRQDIDDTQELHYPAICRAILDTGYDGYLAHEFMPKKDPMATLARCVKLCDV